MRKIRTLAILNFLALIAHIAVSFAAQLRLVDEKSVSEVSGQFNSLFVPPSYTFSIWGVIYTALFIFTVRQIALAFGKQRLRPGNEDTRRMGIWFILANIASIAWLIVWTNENYYASIALITATLVCLFVIHTLLGIHDPSRSIASKTFTQLPLSLFFGWLIVAAIVNASLLLTSRGGFSYSAATWTIAMVCFSTLIGLIVIMAYRNVVVGAVLVWALWGVADKNEATHPVITQTAWICIGITVFASVVRLIANLRTRSVKPARPGERHRTDPDAWPVSPHPIK